jgi:hypothetical protein
LEFFQKRCILLSSHDRLIFMTGTKFNLIVALTISCFLNSCKIQPGSTRHFDDNNPNKVYHLRLNPAVGSQYAYTVTRSTEFEVETDGKKVDNKNKSTMEVAYTIGKDSSGDILLTIVYDKIHLYAKNGDAEEEQDADKAAESTNPVAL